MVLLWITDGGAAEACLFWSVGLDQRQRMDHFTDHRSNSQSVQIRINRSDQSPIASCLITDHHTYHPVGGADEGVALAHGPVQLRTDPKVDQLHLRRVRQQHILALDVPVDHLWPIKISNFKIQHKSEPYLVFLTAI